MGPPWVGIAWSQWAGHTFTTLATPYSPGTRHSHGGPGFQVNVEGG